MIIQYKTEKVQINNRKKKKERKQTTGNLKQRNDAMCAYISGQNIIS